MCCLIVVSKIPADSKADKTSYGCRSHRNIQLNPSYRHRMQMQWTFVTVINFQLHPSRIKSIPGYIEWKASCQSAVQCTECTVFTVFAINQNISITLLTISINFPEYCKANSAREPTYTFTRAFNSAHSIALFRELVTVRGGKFCN